MKGLNATVVFFVGFRSAASIPGEENFILARNLPLEGPNPGSSRFRRKGDWAAAHRAKPFGLPGLSDANLPLGRNSGFG
jgi:hypothetical protein